MEVKVIENDTKLSSLSLTQSMSMKFERNQFKNIDT